LQQSNTGYDVNITKLTYSNLQEDEARKHAADDALDRKREEEMLLYKTPSQNYLPGGGSSLLEDGTELCTCGLMPGNEFDKSRMLSLPTVLHTPSPTDFVNLSMFD
jgi:hypothetical protein